MSLATFTLLNLKRLLADWANLFFSILLPVAFFLLFGALQEYGSLQMAHGNASAYVLVGMAVYGGVIAACGATGSTVVEQSTGWGRQLALTPLSPVALLVSQSASILFRALLPVIAVFIAGLVTNAEMELGAWIGCFLLSFVVALPFGLYGMIFGQLFRSESAVGIASTAIVVLAFAGNALMPLPETLLHIARFTPMYGPTALARFPLTDGTQVLMDDPYLIDDSVWWAIGNTVGWTLLFAIVCVALNRRQKGRA